MFCEKFRMLVCVCAAVVMVGAAAVVANAEAMVGTYVDATTSNTGPASAFSVTQSDTDDQWFVDTSRTYCEGGAVIVSQGGKPMNDNIEPDVFEDAPLLTTTVTGLANGAYDAYLVYWAKGDWTLQAAISGQSLATYDVSSGTEVGDNGTGAIFKRQVLLGTVSVTNGELKVDVDDYIAQPSVGDFRAWYDGVAYMAQPVPEPGTIALLASGLIGLLAYAWRKRW
jgi:hypothetical protein